MHCLVKILKNLKRKILTMNKKERKEFMQEADRIIERLANVLVEEGDKECSLPFLLYVTAKFTAGLLLGLQEEGNQVDIADEYTKAVKELMAIMGKDMKIQSIKNKIKENEEEIAWLKLRQEEIIRTIFNEYDGKGN